METPLGKVYKELIYLKKVKNQTEFGNALGYNKGYVSTLLKQATPLKSEVRMRLNKVFGVSIEWLEKGDESGVSMFGNPIGADTTEMKTPQNQGMNTMLHDLIKAQLDHGAAAKDQAAAMLIMAKSNLMLTEIIQRNLGEQFLKKAVA